MRLGEGEADGERSICGFSGRDGESDGGGEDLCEYWTGEILRFRGFEEEDTAGAGDGSNGASGIALPFGRLRGVDSSSGAKSNSSSVAPKNDSRPPIPGPPGVPKMLPCLTLFLKSPKFLPIADPCLAGVFATLSLPASTSTLLSLPNPALPSILPCLFLGLKALIGTSGISLSIFVISWLCANSLSTLTERSIALRGPNMLPSRLRRLKLPVVLGIGRELSMEDIGRPRRPSSTSWPLDGGRVPFPAWAAAASLSDAGSFSASRRDMAESLRFCDWSMALFCAAVIFATGIDAAAAAPLVALLRTGATDDSDACDISISSWRAGGTAAVLEVAGTAAFETILERFGRGIVAIERCVPAVSARSVRFSIYLIIIVLVLIWRCGYNFGAQVTFDG